MSKDDFLAMVGIDRNKDQDSVGQLVEQAAERGDMDRLRRLAAAGSKDAVDQLVELAQEREDIGELRRLAAGGNQDAADILTELAEETEEPTAGGEWAFDSPVMGSRAGAGTRRGRAAIGSCDRLPSPSGLHHS